MGLLLLTVLLLLPRRHLLSWLPRSNVRELCAQLDVAQSLTGTAAQTTCTVLPPLLTVLLLPRWRNWSRWLPRSNVRELCVPLEVVQRLTGTAAQTTCTVLPQLLTVLLLPPRNISESLLQSFIK